MDLRWNAAETARKLRVREEEMHQAAVVGWCRMIESTYPALRYLFATLNGVKLTPGARRTAVATGLRDGPLDLWLMEPRSGPDGSWCGCVIDLKRVEGAYPSPRQREWAAQLVRCGFRVYFSRGAVETWRLLASYLGISGADHTAARLVRDEREILMVCGRT
ncbi:MAG TPA: hypothetical protein VGS58_21520 [Candidatus Sulfopaludibacter sp.]|nr:hypothetical protein [Candidatus Sulfopaludibacter sp.]